MTDLDPILISTLRILHLGHSEIVESIITLTNFRGQYQNLNI